MAASVSSSSISWWSRSCLSLLSVLLLHFCLTSPRLINSTACMAYWSAAGLFSVWAGTSCVCGVMGVCFGILTLTSSVNPAAATTLIGCHVFYLCEWLVCVFFFLLIVGDFLSPPAMDPPINKQLSNSSAALHSPERGERDFPSRYDSKGLNILGLQWYCSRRNINAK